MYPKKCICLSLLTGIWGKDVSGGQGVLALGSGYLLKKKVPAQSFLVQTKGDCKGWHGFRIWSGLHERQGEQYASYSRSGHRGQKSISSGAIKWRRDKQAFTLWKQDPVGLQHHCSICGLKIHIQKSPVLQDECESHLQQLSKWQTEVPNSSQWMGSQLVTQKVGEGSETQPKLSKSPGGQKKKFYLSTYIAHLFFHEVCFIA